MSVIPIVNTDINKRFDAAIKLDKTVMDGLFQGKIKFVEAMFILNISEDKLHKMISSYEYVSTKEQIREVNKMIIKTIEKDE